MAKTIGQLTQATTLAPGDEFPIEQSGVTKRVAASVVRGGLTDSNIDAAAAIAHTKLANITAGRVLLGNASNVPTATALTGDVTVSNTGVTAIGNSKVVTAMITDANVTAAKLSGAQTGSAPIYGCRAWVNFDGTRNEADTGASTNGANVKIRANGNVASVLKNGDGDFTVTFTTALSDANFSAVATANLGNNLVVVGDVGTHAQSKSTTAYRLVCRYVNFPGSNVPVVNPETVSVQFFR